MYPIKVHHACTYKEIKYKNIHCTFKGCILLKYIMHAPTKELNIIVPLKVCIQIKSITLNLNDCPSIYNLNPPTKQLIYQC